MNIYIFKTEKKIFLLSLQDTLAKYLYHRSGLDLHPGRLTRDPSQRSNSNSCSANTCSSICTLSHQPLRYLDNELAHLKASKRPLVVSFKRIPKEINCTYPINNSNSIMQQNINEQSDKNVNNKKRNDIRLNIFHNTNRCSSMNSLNEKRLYQHHISTLLLNKQQQKTDLPSCSKKAQYDDLLHKTLSMTNERKKSPKLFAQKHFKIFQRNRRSTNNDSKQFSSNSSLSNSDYMQSKNSSPKSFKPSIFDCIHGPKADNFAHCSRRCSFQYPKTRRDMVYHCKYYKSPYDSPEMTANCKLLEENLQEILENLILYPKNNCKKDQNRSFCLTSCDNSLKIRRSYSLPILSQLFQRQISNEQMLATATTKTLTSYNYFDRYDDKNIN